MKRPKVSILCICYNQKDYIRQTLDSFLMQEVDFDIEILINDDASTDGTAEILQEYQRKHPKIVFPTLQKENLYSQGFRGMLTQILFPKAKGEYLAICEGDDYWTDPKKLQKQVDFMDANPDYAVCFHKVRVAYEDTPEKDYIYPDQKEAWYTTEQLLRANYIQTNSVMYRRQDYKNIATSVMPGDWYMHLFHAQFGKIKFIDEVMSVYRKHEAGIWWEYDIDREKIWIQHGVLYVSLLNELHSMYGDTKKYREIISDQIFEMINTLSAIDEKHHTAIISTVTDKYPALIERYIAKARVVEVSQKKQIAELTTQLLAIGDERSELVTKVGEANDVAQQHAKTIDDMKNTRAWRAKEKLEAASNKFKHNN